jgi:hypothetical protein
MDDPQVTIFETEAEAEEFSRMRCAPLIENLSAANVATELGGHTEPLGAIEQS